MIFDRMAPMYGQDNARPYGRNTGINPNGMYTGGNMRPQVGLPPMGGPGQVFQAPQFPAGGHAPPMQQSLWMTGGNQAPIQQGWQTGGNQSGLGQWFNNYRRSAYG